jgi:hypothetical protein
VLISVCVSVDKPVEAGSAVVRPVVINAVTRVAEKKHEHIKDVNVQLRLYMRQYMQSTVNATVSDTHIGQCAWFNVP